MPELSSLSARRSSRWRMDQPPLRTADDAADYIDDVGVLLLFGDKEASLPALREAARDDEAEMLSAGWGEDLERVWTWKDEIPLAGLAWCGRLIAGRQSLLSPHMLDLLYPHSGDHNDFDSVKLSPEARKVAGHVYDNGPSSMREIRAVHGLDSRGGQKVMTELGRALLVTNYGTLQDGSGWPSGVIELTARAFAVDRRMDEPERRRAAVLRFLDTMVEAGPREIVRAFRWDKSEVSEILGTLSEEGHVIPVDAGRYAKTVTRGSFTT